MKPPEDAALFRPTPGENRDPSKAGVAAGHSMRPVKARAAIHAAFAEHGVTDFAFDSADKLAKILQETVPVGLVGRPPTLGLFVRLAVALFGPTCDSADHMPGPFLLPADMREGDWIELGQLGAYGACLRTRFNGFDSALTTEVADPPMLATPGYDG